ncbi:S66 family peptidase [Dethiothermospora halolimnae]|uniref:S66 family peptidase n=1 Tax=Dethiothermospora halolimnae TaxID=3114390 RepID=UPI003CCC411D
MIKPILDYGDKVYIIACSDGLRDNYSENLDSIIDNLKKIGLETVQAKTLFRKIGPFSGTPKERAKELMKGFTDDSIKAIFDISGGDSANEILDFLDYDIIKKNSKPFFGISDLSVILNTLFSLSKIPAYHYTIRNLIGKDSEKQIEKFERSFLKGFEDIYEVDYDWIQGSEMKGTIIGGNIRCFLKLAGTKYMPNPEDKILFLESLGGGPNRMASLLTQFKHIGFLEKINGIILGSFSQMEGDKLEPNIESLVTDILNNQEIPVVKTSLLGHGEDAGCIVIGEEVKLVKGEY